MEIIPTEFPGLLLIRPRLFEDHRGVFVKTFHAPTFQSAGVKFEPQEEFLSTSRRNVIRGMHFQMPPHTQARLVYCSAGRILDVVVDLRRQSPAFGRFFSRELNATTREMVFIPEGFAHGFLSLEEGALVNYVANRPHSPAHDTGILWNSFGFSWPAEAPVLSDRDQKFGALADLPSPF
jgi:dTDP-4-dehydrorhamnose 3,5-epimerase